MALFDGLWERIGAIFGAGGPGGSQVRVSQAVADAVLRRWAEEVDKELRSTRARYKSAMRIDVAPGSITLSLADDLARMIEFGAAPWDLRKTLLAQEGAPWPKRSKAGHLYRPIFFSMTSKQIVEAGGWSAYRKQAIRLSPSIRTGPSRGWGQRLPPGLAPKKAPHHATDPLAGVYRIKQTRGSPSSYGKFRTISWGAKPWYHPGFKARGLMRKATRGIGGTIINLSGRR